MTDYKKFFKLMKDFGIPFFINQDGYYSCKDLRKLPKDCKSVRIKNTGRGNNTKVWGSSCIDFVELSFDKNEKFIQMDIAGGFPANCKKTYKPKEIIKWKK